MLKTENLTKTYKTDGGEVCALRGVNLSFGRGEFVAVLGPSGCGKTTLLNVIGGLDGFEGKLYYGGKDMSSMSAREMDAYRNAKVGFVFQSYNLIPHLTVLENVALTLSLKGVPRAERLNAAREALQRVGLGGKLKSKPNELSGGQAQRAAVARAIAGNPDIILADEPTGALDAKTGEEIASLLKELSKDRLVIMVTHNTKLAESYATRIITMEDGQITGDGGPAVSAEENFEPPKKPRLKLFTAMRISLLSLLSKRGRTFWTAFAGAIGVFGIAIVLAISSGMNTYSTYLQAEAADGTVVTVAETAYDVNNVGDLIEDIADDVPYPENTTGVIPYQGRRLNNLKVTNFLSEEYVEYVKDINPAWVNSISCTYSLNMKVLREDGGAYTRISSWASYAKQMVAEGEQISKNYDVMYAEEGSGYPQDITEVSIVVDRYNRLSVSALEALGLLKRTGAELPAVVPYGDIVGREYTVILNDGWYVQNQNGTYSELATKNYAAAANGQNAVKLKIVSVLRAKSDKAMQWLDAGLAYLPGLTEYLVESSANSVVGKAQAENPEKNVISGKAFENGADGTQKEAYIKALKNLGAYKIPISVSLYPKDTLAKVSITEYLDEWNRNHPGDEVIYTDLTEAVAGVLNLLVEVISYVLIAFSAISLVVSTVMIGVVTYTSVVSRIREIGILRSMGAGKADIAALFNIESAAIGLAAGVAGVILAVLAGVAVNAVLSAALGVDKLVSFSVGIILGMPALSVGLSLIAGLAPAIIAANKKPVDCLRSE